MKPLFKREQLNPLNPIKEPPIHSNKTKKRETATATSFKLHPIAMTHKKVPHDKAGKG
jgi:hypothetical protein